MIGLLLFYFMNEYTLDIQEIKNIHINSSQALERRGNLINFLKTLLYATRIFE